MPLYDRVIGRDDNGVQLNTNRIPVHLFSALMGEVARTRLTGAQAQAQIEALSGTPLSASEVTEVQTLLATISGAATAKLARAKEIDDVLLLAEQNSPVYDTPTKVKTRLGV